LPVVGRVGIVSPIRNPSQKEDEVAFLKPEDVYRPHEAMARAVVPADLKLSSDDPQVRYGACAKVGEERHGRLGQVVSRPDRSMPVGFNDGRRRTNTVEFTFTSGLIRACKRRVPSDGARSNVAVVAVGIARGVR
jgi:hypothetical protein